MRLFEFLIEILQAQASTLQTLSSFLGEEKIKNILNKTNESISSDKNAHTQIAHFIQPATAMPVTSKPYSSLKTAVESFHLSNELEFHLWSYPHYRAFIESSLDLNSMIQTPWDSTALALTEEAIAQANTWLQSLPLSSQEHAKIKEPVSLHWLRFRSIILKKCGKSPLQILK